LGEVSSLEIIRSVASSLDVSLNENEVELVVADDLPTIHCDRERLYQVFDNLITNAIKFTRGTERRKVEVGYVDQGDSYQFYVKDNGVGIDPKYHRKIFDLFHRLEETGGVEGTGLGLAIVEKIVTEHGGRVWVESEKGKGATFRFTLPKP
jgi:signal transduction histidine kinase